MDIFFIVDSSSSIHERNFTKMLEFVASIIEKVTVSPNDAHIGLLQYNSQERLEFSLNTYQSKADVLNHVKNVRYLTGVTYTGKAIRTVLNTEFVQAKVRGSFEFGAKCLILRCDCERPMYCHVMAHSGLRIPEKRKLKEAISKDKTFGSTRIRTLAMPWETAVVELVSARMHAMKMRFLSFGDQKKNVADALLSVMLA